MNPQSHDIPRLLSPAEYRPAWARYGLAAGLVVVGAVARGALTPVIGPHALPFICFVPGILVSAWYGRVGPGILSTVAGGATAIALFLLPAQGHEGLPMFGWVAFLLYLLVGAGIVAALEVLHRANARSVREIGERSRAEQELKLARDQALAASRAKDDFIALLSHELRTPLNPALLLASDAAADPELPNPVRARFREIAYHVGLEARLIDDLLDVNRITRGKLTLARSPLDVHGVVHETVADHAEDLRNRKLVLTLSLRAQASTVLGDSLRLRQVFTNVLRNAMKFTPDGGAIEVRSRTLPDSRIEISFRDSGAGMDASDLARAFEPFRQGQHVVARSGETGGLGVGLTIARLLVQEHDGDIQLASEGRGRGTHVSITIPLTNTKPGAPAPMSSGAAPASANAPGTRAFRILLVEDHAATRSTVTGALERRGHEVRSAGTLAAARAHVATWDFEVLISDIGLPDGDGCVLMAEVCTVRPGVIGLAVSGYGTEADIARCRAAGFDHHLTKPVSVAALAQVLAQGRTARTTGNRTREAGSEF